MAISILLLLIAAILFALAAFGVVAGRINLIAAGLFAWVLADLLPQLHL